MASAECLEHTTKVWCVITLAQTKRRIAEPSSALAVCADACSCPMVHVGRLREFPLNVHQQLFFNKSC